MPPGWYPDPYAPAALRWWDGTAWTGFTYPLLSTPPDPRADLLAEQRAGSWARWALPVGAALQIANLILAVTTLGGFWSDFLVLHASVNRPSSGFGFGTAPRYPSWAVPIALGGVAVALLVMLWLYKAATLARRAGLPARRDPVWAFFGFLVPIVNFWFPYQLAADCLAPHDPARRTVGWWWAWFLAQTFIGIPVVLTSIVGNTPALVLAIASSVLPVLAAYQGIKMIDVIGRAHTKLTARP